MKYNTKENPTFFGRISYHEHTLIDAILAQTFPVVSMHLLSFTVNTYVRRMVNDIEKEREEHLLSNKNSVT